MVVLVDRVGIGMRSLASTLKVFATHQTSIDVLVGHRNRTHFLEVKVERGAVHLLTRLEVGSLSRSQARGG